MELKTYYDGLYKNELAEIPDIKITSTPNNRFQGAIHYIPKFYAPKGGGGT